MVARKINYLEIFEEDLKPKESTEMEALLQETEEEQPVYSTSNIVEGTVVSVNPDGVSVDVGLKSEGFLSNAELDTHLSVGDKIPVVVVRVGRGGAYIKLSHKQAEMVKEWEQIISASKNDIPIVSEVVKKIKGGYIVKFNHLEAFLPFRESGPKTDNLIGKQIKLKVLSYNRKANKILVSRKAYIEELRKQKKEEQKDMLGIGNKITVTVSNITDYGVFVDTGAYDGFIHISDLTWGHLTHPSKVLKIGDEIEAVITKFDEEKERLTLSRKAAMQNPWDIVTDKYHIGDRVKGTVTKLADFGAFVELEPGIEGLVHISEMSWTKRLNKPSDVLSKGETVEAMIIEIDKERKRLSLGLKQIMDNPYEKLIENPGLGGRVKAKVLSVGDKGIKVELNNLEAFIRLQDLAWKAPEEELKKYKEGDEIEAVLLEVNPRKSQLYLGIKQLTEDPWNTVSTKYTENKIVKAKVIKVIDMGAVLELEPGVEGFLKANEMENRSKKPKELYKEGDELEVVIKRIDHKHHRIQLSERLVKKIEEEEAVKNYLGDKVTDVKTSLADIFSDKLGK